MKRFVLTIVISFALAVLSADDAAAGFKRQPPIVLELDNTPDYGRKRPLKRHFVPQYN